jgi:hypothetical protein
MRALPLLVAVLSIAAGCSGDDDATAEPPVDEPAGSGTTEAAPPAASPADDDAAPDCGELTSDDLTIHGINVQVLAAIDDAASLDAAGALSYEGDRYAAILDDMSDVVSADADAVDAVQFFQALNDRARALGPDSSEADFAEYVVFRGETSDVIARQAPLNSALRDACPEL